MYVQRQNYLTKQTNKILLRRSCRTTPPVSFAIDQEEQSHRQNLFPLCIPRSIPVCTLIIAPASPLSTPSCFRLIHHFCFFLFFFFSLIPSHRLTGSNRRCTLHTRSVQKRREEGNYDTRRVVTIQNEGILTPRVYTRG